MTARGHKGLRNETGMVTKGKRVGNTEELRDRT